MTQHRRKQKRDIYQQVTDSIITALETGTVPWRKPWNAGGIRIGEARNAKTGRRYTGVNSLLLALSGYDDPRFLTYRQAVELGGNVKKDEKATLVIFTKKISIKERDDDGNETVKPVQMLRHYFVFNPEQCEGLKLEDWPKPEGIEPLAESERSDDAESLLTMYLDREGISLEHGGSRAFYAPKSDRIQLPRFEKFSSSEAYYGTALHECIHSTGHESRLARKELENVAAYGSASYSREELCAELGSAFLLTELGLQTPEVIDNSAAYLAGWLRALRGDKKLIVSAAARASKAAQFVTG